MVTRDQIEALQKAAYEAGDFVMYGSCAAALACGPDCFGWSVCEEAIKNGRG